MRQRCEVRVLTTRCVRSDGWRCHIVRSCARIYVDVVFLYTSPHTHCNMQTRFPGHDRSAASLKLALMSGANRVGDDGLPLECANEGCGGPGVLRCARCKSVKYCSAACQKVHWKHGGHKQACTERETATVGAQPATAATVGGRAAPANPVAPVDEPSAPMVRGVWKFGVHLA
jgi:hypothetical protein